MTRSQLSLHVFLFTFQYHNYVCRCCIHPQEHYTVYLFECTASHSMPLADIARRQHSPHPSRRPNPRKLPSMPNLARGKQEQFHTDALTYCGRNIKAKIRRGMSNIRTYVRSQIHFESSPISSPRSPPAVGIDADSLHSLMTTSGVTSDVPGVPQVNKVVFNSLRRKISQRVLATLNPGTVIVKPELRCPPSVPVFHSSGTTAQLTETPPTSEGTTTTVSPGSVRRYEVPSITEKRHDMSTVNLPLTDHSPIRKLSTIPETDKKQIVSVKTCEATAAAKIYLETRYNSFLSGTDARQTRGDNLDQRLSMMRLPPYLKHRIRRS